MKKGTGRGASKSGRRMGKAVSRQAKKPRVEISATRAYPSGKGRRKG